MPDVFSQSLKGIAPQPYPCFYGILVCTSTGPSSGPEAFILSSAFLCITRRGIAHNLEKSI